MLLFCVKTIVKESQSHNFELAHLKKKKKKKMMIMMMILAIWRLSGLLLL